MVYASLEKGIAKFRNAETAPKSHYLHTFFGLLLITFTYTEHLMRPYAQFTWSRPTTRPNDMRTICSSPLCGQAQHCRMCRAQWKQCCCTPRATPNG